MASDRPFVLEWRSAVLNSQQTSTVKLCLLALAEWANPDGSSCYPSIPSIALKASVNEKTVRRSLDQAEAAGFITRTHKGSAQGWRRFVYLPTLPRGADTTPARSIDGVGTKSAPSPATCGLSVPNVRTLSPERVGTESTDLSNTYPTPRNSKSMDAARPAERVPENRFAEFYQAFPRKVSRQSAEKAWTRAKLDPIASAIVADVRASVAPGGRWHGVEDRFIPHPATYLNGRRWEDEWRKPGAAIGRLPRDTRSDDELAEANEAALARVESRIGAVA